MPPDLSVVIPVFNRGELIRHTLASVRAAAAGLRVEIIAVDDGSARPLADDLARLGLHVDRLIRQDNRGLLFARLAGLAAAAGRHVLFLDSDDLVSADKLRGHVAALDAGADVAYTDTARQTLDDATGAVGPPRPDAPLRETTNAAEFFLAVQPAPHAPAFRADYLRARVADAPFPPSALYNPVAEIWFYHVCAPFPARVVKSPGLALIGQHAGARLTNHWEKLAVASLAVQEAFARTCPTTAAAHAARTHFATKAFAAWRRLPRDFSPEFSQRLLRLFVASPDRPPLAMLGGSCFRAVAAVLGPVAAGRLFRRVQTGPYAGCRTLDDAALARLLATLPQP